VKKHFDIGPGVPCDLDVLLNTRMLIQANSGSGKSWLLRRLLEQTSGRVQQLVVDPEGEFATLRERFDYVLAAKTGGDTLAHPRAAKLLAERLLELGVSAVLDIYELKAHERVSFVKLFLEALVDAPKRLWHPVLVVLDEAHVFAPEKGSAESLQAVIDLATRGRKRGYCLVQATQRLSKLHKDAAAEMNNKLIGRSALDVDMERAGDELGLTKAGRQVLRDLDAGEFFAFGPALTRTVTRVRVGPVVTSHPKAGSKLAGVVPPPTEKVKAVLSKLADLPVEAEQRERSVQELRQEIAAKDRRIKELERATSGFSPRHEAATAAAPKPIEILTDADRKTLAQLAHHVSELQERMDRFVAGQMTAITSKVQALLDGHAASVRDNAAWAAEAIAERTSRASVVAVLEKLDRVTVAPRLDGATNRSRVQGRASTPIRFATERQVTSSRIAPENVDRPPTGLNGHPASLPGPEQKILNAVAELEILGLHPADKIQVGLLAGYTNVRSGGFSEPLGRLVAGGHLVSPQPGKLAITQAGRAAAVVAAAPSSSEEMQARVLARLTGPEQKLLRALLARYPDAVTKEDLGAACGYSNIRSGGFSEPLGRLNTLGIVRTPARGSVVAAPFLFLEV